MIPPTFKQRKSFLGVLPGLISWKPINLGKQRAGAIFKLSVPVKADRLTVRPVTFSSYHAVREAGSREYFPWMFILTSCKGI